MRVAFELREGEAVLRRQVEPKNIDRWRGHLKPQVREGTAELRFWVADTGPGIPPEETERIFDRFYRLDASRSRARVGSGLGLAIVKSLVEAHGGRVWVESREGEGSRFTVALPFKEPQV
jgi:signal transduction histidine kinase